MQIQRIPVSSSNLKSVGYDEEERILEIEFHNNSIYQYFNVPQQIYTGLMRASSKGQYHHMMIKDRFRFRRIR